MFVRCRSWACGKNLSAMWRALRESVPGSALDGCPVRHACSMSGAPLSARWSQGPGGREPGLQELTRHGAGIRGALKRCQFGDGAKRVTRSVPAQGLFLTPLGPLLTVDGPRGVAFPSQVPGPTWKPRLCDLEQVAQGL